MPEQSTGEQLRRLSVSAEGFGSGTALYAYIRWLNELLEKPDALFTQRYRPIVEAERESGARRPFLSVITRTQGRRPAMLREMLMSLAAQTDEDYELLLIGHRLSGEGRREIDACLAEMPASFRARTRRFELDGGNRTAPLNLGFAHARGAYAAVLDDDDLVFDDWVQRFHEAAREAPGAILHAYVVTQKWETLPGGGERLRSVGAPGTECCGDFELSRQLTVNLCPLLGLAFPTLYFQKWGLCFDESLSTTEDWDYLMRLSPLAGVKDIRRPTGLYRLWQNTENSQTAHPPLEWQENYERIRRKFRDTPILFPAGSEKTGRVERRPPPTPRRARIKARWRRILPRPLWALMRKTYRRLGGQKWLG